MSRSRLALLLTLVREEPLGSPLAPIAWVRAIRHRERRMMREREEQARAHRARVERLAESRLRIASESWDQSVLTRLPGHFRRLITHDACEIAVMSAGDAVVRYDGGWPVPSALERTVLETGSRADRAYLDDGVACYELALPLFADRTLRGVITLRRRSGPYVEAEIEDATTLCGLAGIALMSFAELHETVP